jgi:hypothetical protein
MWILKKNYGIHHIKQLEVSQVREFYQQLKKRSNQRQAEA